MALSVNGKIIDTSPIKNLIVQGESKADIIDITLPLAYGNIDLTALTWTMRAVSEKNTLVEAACTKTAGAEALTVSWAVTAPFAAVDGKVTLELRGSDGGELIIKFTGSDIYVKENASGEYDPPEDVFETTLAQMQALLAASYNPGLHPLAVYDTLEALQTAHPAGAAGDQYAVGDGTAANTVIYIWNVDTEAWGLLGGYAEKGDKGDTGAAGATGDTGPAGPTGADGAAPTIDAATGHWFINGADTGYAADTALISDTSSTAITLELADNHDYRYGELTSLTLTAPTLSGKFDAHVAFTSGATATTFSGPTGKYVGADVRSNVFAPAASKRYNLAVWYDGVNANIAISGVA